MNDQARGLLITLIGILCVVPDSLFVRLIDAAPLTIAFWRLALAGGLICCWILLTKGTGPFRAVLKTGRYGLVYMVGTGASGVLFVLAVSLTSVANVVFILASLPIFATVYSRIFLAEPISRRMLITIAVVMVGIAIIAYGSGGNGPCEPCRGFACAGGVRLVCGGSDSGAPRKGHFDGAGGGVGLSDRCRVDRAFCASTGYAG